MNGDLARLCNPVCPLLECLPSSFSSFGPSASLSCPYPCCSGCFLVITALPPSPSSLTISKLLSCGSHLSCLLQCLSSSLPSVLYFFFEAKWRLVMAFSCLLMPVQTSRQLRGASWNQHLKSTLRRSEVYLLLVSFRFFLPKFL